MKISGGNTALFQTARGIQPLSSSQELAQASKVPIQLTTATFEAFLLKDPGLPIYLYLYVPHAAGAQIQFHLVALGSWERVVNSWEFTGWAIKVTSCIQWDFLSSTTAPVPWSAGAYMGPCRAIVATAINDLEICKFLKACGSISLEGAHHHYRNLKIYEYLSCTAPPLGILPLLIFPYI